MTNEVLNNPILCGGTFFTLLLQAVKQGNNERNVFGTNKTAFKEGDVLNGLIQIASPSYIRPECDMNFKSVVSTYKNCKTAKSGRLPIADKAIMVAFDNHIKTEYMKTLTSMAAFVDSFINVADRGLWLVKALLELIETDDSINNSDVFYILQNGSALPKKEITTLFKICLPSLLLGIWHFIVINRNDNSIGLTTIESWRGKTKSKYVKKEFISKIGDVIQKQIFLLPFSAKATENIKINTTADNSETTEDSSETTESFITTNNSRAKYQQNNYVQTFNVGINNGIINGLVINQNNREEP